jgi:RES domain-containing protein
MLQPIWPTGPERLAWRLDDARFATTWDSGEGAYLFGGRWSPKGRRVVYCSLDASTAVLEVAVHKGFRTLDVVPHVMTVLKIHDVAEIRILTGDELPNVAWLNPGLPSASQQAFGADLLEAHPFVAVPSAVSPSCWNVLFDPAVARGRYTLAHQERYALDTRLNPPA